MAIIKTKPRDKAPAPKGSSKTLTVEEEYALNCEAAYRIKREARQGPRRWK